jgi:hypothetical protein
VMMAVPPATTRAMKTRREDEDVFEQLMDRLLSLDRG